MFFVASKPEEVKSVVTVDKAVPEKSTGKAVILVSSLGERGDVSMPKLESLT